MDEKEQNIRLEALGHAVRHKTKDETAETIVDTAEQYLKFLKGDDAGQP